MKTNLKHVLGTALVAVLAAGGALAQEVTPFPDVAPRSDLTREAVMAEVAQARADGTYDRGGEASFEAPAVWTSTLTRADVMAEVARAKADGTFDASGEYSVGADTAAARSAAAGTQRFASSSR